MKCLCGYQQSPNNAKVLAAHVQDCMHDGVCKDIEMPEVVWRDGEFTVVAKANDGERTYDLGLVRHTPLTVTQAELIDSGELLETVLKINTPLYEFDSVTFTSGAEGSEGPTLDEVIVEEVEKPKPKPKPKPRAKKAAAPKPESE
jgi:hypothetical protein